MDSSSPPRITSAFSLTISPSNGNFRSASDTRGNRSRGSFLARNRSPTSFAPSRVVPSTAMDSAMSAGSGWSRNCTANPRAAAASSPARARTASTFTLDDSFPSASMPFTAAVNSGPPSARPALIAAARSGVLRCGSAAAARTLPAAARSFPFSTAAIAAIRTSGSVASSSPSTNSPPAPPLTWLAAVNTSNPAFFTSTGSSCLFR